MPTPLGMSRSRTQFLGIAGIVVNAHGRADRVAPKRRLGVGAAGILADADAAAAPGATADREFVFDVRDGRHRRGLAGEAMAARFRSAFHDPAGRRRPGRSPPHLEQLRERGDNEQHDHRRGDQPDIEGVGIAEGKIGAPGKHGGEHDDGNRADDDRQRPGRRSRSSTRGGGGGRPVLGVGVRSRRKAHIAPTDIAGEELEKNLLHPLRLEGRVGLQIALSVGRGDVVGAVGPGDRLDGGTVIGVENEGPVLRVRYGVDRLRDVVGGRIGRRLVVDPKFHRRGPLYDRIATIIRPVVINNRPRTVTRWIPCPCHPP